MGEASTQQPAGGPGPGEPAAGGSQGGPPWPGRSRAGGPGPDGPAAVAPGPVAANVAAADTDAAADSGAAEAGGGAGGGPDPEGVIDLLGVLAYASLVAFFRLSDDAAVAVSLADKEAMAGMAVAQFGHFKLLRRRLEEMHADPEQAMSPFVAAIDAFHARTAPADWLEGLVKAYVGDGIAADFYRALAELLDQETRELVLEVLGDDGQAEFAVARV